MPGRQESTAVIMPGAVAKAPRPSTARVLVPRLVALALLVAAVAAIAGLGGYARGRGSVDENALQAKAYAAGQLAGAHAAAKPAAAKAASASRSAPVHSRLVRGPSAEVRAELRRAYAAGVRAASVAQRARGRALGAAAVLGSFPGGWATGRWYVVRLAPGGTVTAGRPRLASRVGPLAAGEGYTACQGGQSVCPVARGR